MPEKMNKRPERNTALLSPLCGSGYGLDIKLILPLCAAI
jgi:hypothetical protein